VSRFHPVLLGAVAGLALLAAAATAWLTLFAPGADAAGEPLPFPPSVPRIASGADYDACLDLARQDADAARVQAERWEAAGGGEAARHCLALAMLAQGDAMRAADRLQALASRSEAPAAARAAVFAQAGQAWMMAGQPGRAFAAATLGLVLMPDDVELLTDRALTLGALGRTAEAVADLDRVLAIDPRRVEALVLRAAAKRRLDRIVEAEADVTRALQLGPENAEALLERGILRQLRGNTAGARADWERAVALAPDTATADLALQNLALSDAGPQRR
jgi:tetratricopeptide (TPR) repeat protein